MLVSESTKMPETTVTALRNGAIEYFPLPERTWPIGEYFSGYLYLVGGVSVDSENALGKLRICVRTSFIPLQNPGYLNLQTLYPALGGLVFGLAVPRTITGSLGLVYEPWEESVGSQVVLGIDNAA